jgi:nucleoside-diphosphate-sugar epimerase
VSLDNKMAAVIIFGPTGRVGSVVARSVSEYGAGKVILAMRDPEKTVPGLSEGEKIYADFTKPETVRDAVSKSGAKRAFIYLVARNGMRESIEALASEGIEFVVFLSSSTVSTASAGDIRKIPQENFIPWLHAQVEINLEEVFGSRFAAIRPGYFASNSTRWKKMIQTGTVKLVYPTAKLDWITSEDIGQVSAALLAGVPLEGSNVIKLHGPELQSQEYAVAAIGRAIGKQIEMIELNEEQGVEVYMKEMGFPAESVVRGLLKMLKSHTGDDAKVEGYEQAVKNIKKYSGKEPMRFEEWARAHAEEFSE